MHTRMTIMSHGWDYYQYAILHRISSFPHSESSSFSSSHSLRPSRFPPSATQLQNQESNAASAKGIGTKNPFLKRILVVDDDPDIALTFGVGLEGYYFRDNSTDDKIRFEVYTYNNPNVALSEFKPNFYDLMLTDIYMPHMNGFELSQKILGLDSGVRICFISAADVNINALREVYPKVRFGCFIRKPVTIDYLVKRLLAELD